MTNCFILSQIMLYESSASETKYCAEHWPKIKWKIHLCCQYEQSRYIQYKLLGTLGPNRTRLLDQRKEGTILGKGPSP